MDGCRKTEPRRTWGLELEEQRQRGVGLVFDCWEWLWTVPAGDQRCDGHVPSTEVMKETWHGGYQQSWCRFSIDCCVWTISISGHHSPGALLGSESRFRWQNLPVISVSTLPSWWLAADTQFLCRSFETRWEVGCVCWLFHLLLQRAVSCFFEISLLLLICPQFTDWLGPQESMENGESNSLFLLIEAKRMYTLETECYFPRRISLSRFSFCPGGNQKWLKTGR